MEEFRDYVYTVYEDLRKKIVVEEEAYRFLRKVRVAVYCMAKGSDEELSRM